MNNKTENMKDKCVIPTSVPCHSWAYGNKMALIERQSNHDDLLLASGKQFSSESHATFTTKSRSRCESSFNNSISVTNGAIKYVNLNRFSEGYMLSKQMSHNYQWDTELHHPILRKLVNESHLIFLNVQEFVKDNSGVLKKSHLLQYSRAYRSVLKAYAQEICESTTEEESTSLAQMLYMAEHVWNLCEVLFIDSGPSSLIVAKLLDWICLSFTDLKDTAQEIVREESPYLHVKYWETVYGFLLQGCLDECQKLLMLHVDSSNKSFQTIFTLLERMPRISNQDPNAPVQEFKMAWRHFQEACARLQLVGEFLAEPKLEIMIEIMSGNIKVFEKIHTTCRSWYGFLVAKLLFSDPTASVADLQHHTDYCINYYGGDKALQLWDKIILSALNLQIHSVIQDSSSVTGNWWFPAHLTDLLFHCNILNCPTNDSDLTYGPQLREFLLLDYVAGLMTHESLWQVAVNYLDHCPVSGRATLIEYIEKMPLESDMKAKKLIRICEKHDMVEQVGSIAKVLGMKARHHGQLGTALSWALLSKDTGFITYLAQIYLEKYASSGRFIDLDFIDHLGPSVLISPKLTFLGSYRDFHKLYESEEFNLAAEKLVSLISSDIAPKEFWLMLLMDALPLLEAPSLIFNMQQTFKLLHCLEELEMAERISCVKNEHQQSSINLSKKELLRLALARNLAKSIVLEGKLTI